MPEPDKPIGGGDIHIPSEKTWRDLEHVANIHKSLISLYGTAVTLDPQQMQYRELIRVMNEMADENDRVAIQIEAVETNDSLEKNLIDMAKREFVDVSGTFRQNTKLSPEVIKNIFQPLVKSVFPFAQESMIALTALQVFHIPKLIHSPFVSKNGSFGYRTENQFQVTPLINTITPLVNQIQSVPIDDNGFDRRYVAELTRAGTNIRDCIEIMVRDLDEHEGDPIEMLFRLIVAKLEAMLSIIRIGLHLDDTAFFAPELIRVRLAEMHGDFELYRFTSPKSSQYFGLTGELKDAIILMQLAERIAERYHHSS